MDMKNYLRTQITLYEEGKLPYMKKTRKKKQVCGAACFMAAEIKFSEDVRPSVRLSVRPTSRVRSVVDTIEANGVVASHVFFLCDDVTPVSHVQWKWH